MLISNRHDSIVTGEYRHPLLMLRLQIYVGGLITNKGDASRFCAHTYINRRTHNTIHKRERESANEARMEIST